jgi:uncharacterized protein (DUF1800 family)
MNRTRFTGFLIAVVVAVIPAVELKGTAAAESRIPDPDSPDQAAITHVLNRLTFGARAGEADRVRAMGLATWLDLQLHPSRINDQAAEAMLPQLDAAPDSADPRELRRFARRQVETLASAKILRAMYGERQLQEVLADFWFNHFNVYAGKGRTAEYLPEYERDVIRPHVFDHFRDLLEADAKSPAMLFYLDNWLSADPNAARRLADMRAQQTDIRNQRRLGRRGFSGGFPPSAPQPPRQPAAANSGKKKERGLNENYGRELLELHTLGVDGGYTQKDVIEVARAFTGWTIDRDGKFRFVPALHDAGEKIVLGHTIKAGGGIDDGEKVLDILASHPSTAHHIAFELAQRLVADEPPPALVDHAAARFRETNGDLREVVKTIVTSPEFVAPAHQGAKFKTPFELVVSAVRTTGATVSDARAFVQTLQQLGEPLYMCQPPTGYHDTADTWVSAGGLVTRMNFATRLASGNMPGVTLPPSAPPANELALRIGSPEFQRH